MPAPMPAAAQPPEARLAALAQARREVLKDEPGTLLELLGEGADAVVRKTYRNRGLRLLQAFLRRSRARREHDNLRRVHLAGLPCTEPVHWSERRVLGCARESVLVTRFVPDCRPMKMVLRELPPATAWRARRRLIGEMGRLLAELHRKGLLWGTPMPRNFLLQGDPPTGRLLLCDMPAAIWYGRDLHSAHAALLDLYEATFSPSRRRDFSRPERLRYLLAYCGDDRATARQLWRALAGRPRWAHRVRKAAAMLLRTYLLRTSPEPAAQVPADGGNE